MLSHDDNEPGETEAAVRGAGKEGDEIGRRFGKKLFGLVLSRDTVFFLTHFSPVHMSGPGN